MWSGECLKVAGGLNIFHPHYFIRKWAIVPYNEGYLWCASGNLTVGPFGFFLFITIFTMQRQSPFLNFIRSRYAPKITRTNIPTCHLVEPKLYGSLSEGPRPDAHSR